MITDKRLVAEFATKYGKRVRSFLAARVRNSADAADLAQEVFLRLLRVDRHEHIRNPEAYLVTIASHVLHQQMLKDTPLCAPLSESSIESQLSVDTDPIAHVHLQHRLEALDRALRKVSPRARAAFILQRRDGCTLDEIAARMGISRGMVKKHLAKALQLCARHIET